jgi:hypothetical protein
VAREAEAERDVDQIDTRVIGRAAPSADTHQRRREHLDVDVMSRAVGRYCGFFLRV